MVFRPSSTRIALLIVPVLIEVSAVTGCSGGANSSSAPPVVVALPGSGTGEAINQKVTFTVEVPAPAVAGSSRGRMLYGTRRAVAASATPVPPYLSPATAAIVLSLAEINGVSPQKAAPAIPAIAVTCQSCTFTVPNIPAALGINRYFVQTYSGYANGQAAGNLISTGFVDVAVPAKTSPTLGGAPILSVGGYVAAIHLAPGSVDFTPGVAGDQSILVSALDAAGATIVGSVQYVSPIVLTVVDAQYFAVDGAATESIPGTLQRPVNLHYTGGNSFGTLVNATSTNENGVQVSATPLAANVESPPTPTPTPVPPGHTPAPTPPPSPIPSPTKPPATTSLYVADTFTDTVSEYGFVAQLESGNAPNPVPTPKRVMQFNPTLAGTGIAGFGCTFSPFYSSVIPTGTGNGTVGVQVGANGTIFTLPTCLDINANSYIFGFPATAVGGNTAPSIVDPVAATEAAGPEALGLATTGSQNMLYSEFLESAQNVLYGTPTTSNGKQPTLGLGTACFQEFSQPACMNAPPGAFGFSQPNGGLGLDTNGFAYLPSYWSDAATGDAASLLNPAALLVIPASASSSSTTIQSAIAGKNSLIGGYEGDPLAVAVDGVSAYALANPGFPGETADGLTSFYPGVSACPPPSSNAPVNADSTNGEPVQCADGQMHSYLVGYTIGASLLGPGASGTDVDLVPRFVIGGDVVGGFGCGFQAGQFLAASAGYVYVINQQPSCLTGNLAPEIDIYNTNGLTGVHTDIAPVAKILLPTGFPAALSIGPSGTVTGGQSLLRHALKSYRPYLHRWRTYRPQARKHAPWRPAARTQ